MKKMTLTRIGERLGVSHATVSRALNGRGGVGDALRARILALARELSYTRARSRRTVAILAGVSPEFDWYSGLLCHHLRVALRSEGFRVLQIGEDDFELLLGEWLVDGVVSLLPFHHIAAFWARTQSRPLVCVNDYGDRLGGVSSVCSDDRAGIRWALDRLYRAGHREVAFVSLAAETLNGTERRQTFLAMVREHHFRLRPQVVEILPGDDILRRLPDEVTGVVCASEMLGEVVYRRLYSGGRLRSLDAFVCWVFPDMNWYRDAGIATLEQDYPLLATRAVQLLRERFETGDDPAARTLTVDYRCSG